VGNGKSQRDSCDRSGSATAESARDWNFVCHGQPHARQREPFALGGMAHGAENEIFFRRFGEFRGAPHAAASRESATFGFGNERGPHV